MKPGAGTDLHLFTHENLLEQLATAPFRLGAFTVRFYAEHGRPVNRVTPVLSDFYLYPSGGTLRDSAFIYDLESKTTPSLPPSRTSFSNRSPSAALS